jgi:hypothetical protein
VLGAYVHSAAAERPDGLLQRYGRRLAGHGLEGFSLHHVRHTNATHAVEQGAAMQSVARYLGQNFTAGNTTQATVFYVAGGTEAMRERTVAELQAVGGRGYVFDAMARVAVEASGAAVASHPEAQRLVDELPLPEALARLRDHDLLEAIPHTVEDAVRLLRDGFVVMPTEWGACVLRAEDGHCPAGGHRCHIGISPDDPRVAQGCGCRYQVLLPHALERLEADADVKRAQLLTMGGDPQWEAWRGPLQTEVSILEMQIENARALQRAMPESDP